MKPPKKVWVIDVDDERRRPLSMARQAAREAASRRRPRRRVGGHQPPDRPSLDRPPVTSANRGDRERHEHLLPRVLLTYAMGPVMGLLARRSRVEAIWAVLGVGALTAGIVGSCLLRRPDALAWLIEHRLGMAALLAGAVAVSLIAGAAWSRAIYQLGLEEREPGERLPRRLRHPRVGGVLGLIVPGLGLLFAGRPGRAAWAWWLAGMLVTAGWILVHAAWLWRWSRLPHAGGLSGGALEIVLLCAVIAGLTGMLGWIVQALDGARCIEAKSPRRGRGDRFALALLAAIVLFCVAFEPRATARLADDIAVALELEGLRRIPLCLTRIAAALDPADPAHVMHVATLYDQLERPVLAARERAQLRARWHTYDLARHRREQRLRSEWTVAAPINQRAAAGLLELPD